MRRAAPAILATAGALGALAAFHSSPEKPASVATGAPPSPTASAIGPTTTSTTPAASIAPTTQATSTTTAPAARAVTGPDIGTRYGDVQIQAIVRGRQLLDVRAIRLPFDRSRSQRLSDYAAPRLRAEALQAQSANIDLVSGATYTSEGYIQSLQAALDAARPQ